MQSWRLANGTRYDAPHPPLSGNTPAVLWDSHEVPVAEPELLTRATAHYPAEMTWQLLNTLLLHTKEAEVPRPIATSPTDHSGRPVISLRNPLRGKVKNSANEEQSIGSLRDIQKSVEQLPGHAVAGGQVRKVLEQFLELLAIELMLNQLCQMFRFLQKQI